MDYDYSKKLFVEELKKRIELLSSSKVTENVDNSSYNDIMNELFNFGIASEKEITKDNIKKLDKNTIIKVLILAGANEITADFLANKSDEFAYTEITNKINNYINTYKDVKFNQSSTFKAKLTLYIKYVNLLEKDFSEGIFEDIDELTKVMLEVGLEQEHQNKILEFIGKKNLLKGLNELIINIAVERERIEKYIQDSQAKKTLSDIYANQEIDIELIPTIAIEIAKSTGLDKDVANNITAIAICEKELLEELPKAGESDKSNVIECAKLAFSYIKTLHPVCVYQAKKIIDNLEEKYYEALSSNITKEDLESYQERPITDIENEVGNRELAINLKELSMYKIIKTTIETIETLDVENEDYKKATDALENLVKSYNDIELKKAEFKRIN